MTMIDKRPPEVETKQQAGNWEGDLIAGTGSASAVMTLRERKTQYGIVVNLPTTTQRKPSTPPSSRCSRRSRRT
jgi:IS30 family transposase